MPHWTPLSFDNEHVYAEEDEHAFAVVINTKQTQINSTSSGTAAVACAVVVALVVGRAVGEAAGGATSVVFAVRIAKRLALYATRLR